MSKLLPHMSKSIFDSSFVAIDFEMSGIVSHPLLRNSNLDTIDMRYFKAASNVRHHTALQLGLCCFIDDGSSFSCIPYNLDLLDSNPIFDTSAATFLTTNNFDFNACFYDHVKSGHPMTKPPISKFHVTRSSDTSLSIDISHLYNHRHVRYLDHILQAYARKSEVSSNKIELHFDVSPSDTIIDNILAQCNNEDQEKPHFDVEQIIRQVCGKTLVFHNGFQDLLHVSYILSVCEQVRGEAA